MYAVLLSAPVQRPTFREGSYLLVVMLCFARVIVSVTLWLALTPGYGYQSSTRLASCESQMFDINVASGGRIVVRITLSDCVSGSCEVCHRCSENQCYQRDEQA